MQPCTSTGINLYLDVTRILKRRLSSRGEGREKLWALSLLLCKCWRTSERKNVPWKAWLFKCLHILNMTSISLKLRPDVYATCLCSPIYLFLLLYQDWAKFLIILMTPEPCSAHQYLQYAMNMINLFWSIPHRFFRYAMAWPELNFMFKHCYYWSWIT